MKRRSFLKGLLGTAAVLTTGYGNGKSLAEIKTLNQLRDAETLRSEPGGFLAKSSRRPKSITPQELQEGVDGIFQREMGKWVEFDDMAKKLGESAAQTRERVVADIMKG